MSEFSDEDRITLTEKGRALARPRRDDDTRDGGTNDG